MIGDTSELYAGGETGLFVLAEPAAFGAWRPLLEDAEGRGLSGLLTDDPDEVGFLRARGVRRICAVAAGAQTEAAFTLARQRLCDALVLLSPEAVSDVGAVRMPRLFVGGSATADTAAIRALNEASRGPTAMRFFPSPARGPALLSADRGLVAESICLFAIRCLGAGERPPHNRALGAHRGEFV